MRFFQSFIPSVLSQHIDVKELSNNDDDDDDDDDDHGFENAFY